MNSEYYKSDYYDYLEIKEIGFFHKYIEIDRESFIKRFYKFPNVLNHYSASFVYSFFICNEYLILRDLSLDTDYVFKNNTDFNYLNTEVIKINKNFYKLWTMSSSKDGVLNNYYSHIIVKNDKLILKDSHLKEIILQEFYEFRNNLEINLEIIQNLLNDMTPLDFDNLITSSKSIDKYSL